MSLKPQNAVVLIKSFHSRMFVLTPCPDIQTQIHVINTQTENIITTAPNSKYNVQYVSLWADFNHRQCLGESHNSEKHF